MCVQEKPCQGQSSCLDRFYIGFLDHGVVDIVTESVDLHSHSVDPRELAVSTSFFQSLMSEDALSKCPQTRLYLVMTQYTMEKTRAQAGGPSVAPFLDTSQILGLCRKPDILKTIEANIREIKCKYLPRLVLSLGERVARLELGCVHLQESKRRERRKGKSR